MQACFRPFQFWLEFQGACDRVKTVNKTVAWTWFNKDNWWCSAHNTKWCLLGCAIGDYGTILVCQLAEVKWPALYVFGLAMLNGLLTSIMLETYILKRSGMVWQIALRTALGMSLISMLAMETAMNATDYLLVGGARLTWWVLPFSLVAGFLTPWPYNYWRLEKYNKSCH